MRTPMVRALVAALLISLPGLVSTTVVAPAHAAGGILVGWDPDQPDALLVDATATVASIDLFFNSQTQQVEISSEVGFDLWPDDCTADTYTVVCPGAAVGSMGFTMGPGDDEINVLTVCVPVILASLGEGADYFRNTACEGSEVSVVDAGPGDDKVYLSGGGGFADGGSGDDEIIGGPSADEIIGGDGDDFLIGEGGDDEISGQSGSDRINGGLGDDVLDGGSGDDLFGLQQVFSVDPGSNVVTGGPGVDTLDLRSEEEGVRISLDDKANDGRPGESGNVGSDVENVLGTAYDDVLVGSKGANLLDGYSGDDVIDGGAGNDRLDGSFDNDKVKGGAGKDTVIGGSHNDTLDPGPGADAVWGDTARCDSYDCPLGADTIKARDGTRDRIDCGPGGDVATLDRKDLVSSGAIPRCERIRRK